MEFDRGHSETSINPYAQSPKMQEVMNLKSKSGKVSARRANRVREKVSNTFELDRKAPICFWFAPVAKKQSARDDPKQKLFGLKKNCSHPFDHPRPSRT